MLLVLGLHVSACPSESQQGRSSQGLQWGHHPSVQTQRYKEHELPGLPHRHGYGTKGWGPWTAAACSQPLPWSHSLQRPGLGLISALLLPKEAPLLTGHWDQQPWCPSPPASSLLYPLRHQSLILYPLMAISLILLLLPLSVHQCPDSGFQLSLLEIITQLS